MPEKRYYIDQEFQEGQRLYLEDRQLHHLLHVMRQKIGQSLELVNGKGFLAKALLQSIEKKRALVEIQSLQKQKRPSFSIILAQAVPLANRLDNILEKACELGVSEIRLFQGLLGESLPKQRLERLQAVLIAAMKQCGRLYLPKLSFFSKIQDLQALAEPSFFGEIEALNFDSAWQQKNPKEAAVFFIGPESGFAAKEIDHLKSLGAIGVKLHENILRTDTAAIVAMSLVSQKIF